MIKRKAITVLTLSVMMAAAIGFGTPYKYAYAASNDQAIVYTDENLVRQENASLVIKQNSGSNDITLELELHEDYDKSITSFEVCIQLDQTKIKEVTMEWNKEFTKNHCRYSYDQTNGKLRIYVVDSKDLLQDRKITIGTMSIKSDESSKFTSLLVLQELKAVDLQHKSDVIMVDRSEHAIEFTPTSKPSTDNPNTKPDTNPDNNSGTSTPIILKVQDIILSSERELLEVGQTVSLTATVVPSNVANPTVSWYSDNEKVAKVSSDGTVTAVSAGTANITVRSLDGSNIKETAEIKVNEKAVKVTKVKLSKTSVVLKPKQSTTLKVTISPSKATNKSLVWSSSNKKVATVKDGKITAKSVGTATITVKANDGSNKKATCKITVADIKLNKTKATLKKGKSLSLKATVSGKSKKVTWKSSNTKIVTVSKTGKVTAKKAGTATITAKANGVTTTFKVTVK